MTNGENIYKNLKEKYGIKSILFCPYKEEMFDSMESVYEAALKDNEVEVGIMAVPYFTLWQLIPVGLKQEFNGIGFPFALNQRWDVIVFHYPYDTKNTITRPLITSGVMKCFCSKLVYIPYYLTDDIEFKENVASQPGIINSDLVIVSNERQRQTLENHFKKHNVGAEIVAWGSPKEDRREVEIPESWKQKKDGRKVVLLQTSVIPYLNNVNKLKEIEEFIDNTEDCILWRPHPLYEDTIKSIRPYELAKFYLLKEKVDILDDTSDYRIAFEFCDEMVSDGSSIDTLFIKTQKPFKHLN